MTRLVLSLWGYWSARNATALLLFLLLSASLVRRELSWVLTPGPSRVTAGHEGARLGFKTSSGLCLDKREPNKAAQLGTSLKAFLVLVLLIFLDTGENSQTVFQHVCGTFFFPRAPAQSFFLHPGFCLLTFHLPPGSE